MAAAGNGGGFTDLQGPAITPGKPPAPTTPAKPPSLQAGNKSRRNAGGAASGRRRSSSTRASPTPAAAGASLAVSPIVAAPGTVTVSGAAAGAVTGPLRRRGSVKDRLTEPRTSVGGGGGSGSGSGAPSAHGPPPGAAVLSTSVSISAATPARHSDTVRPVDTANADRGLDASLGESRDTLGTPAPAIGLAATDPLLTKLASDSQYGPLSASFTLGSAVTGAQVAGAGAAGDDDSDDDARRPERGASATALESPFATPNTKKKKKKSVTMSLDAATLAGVMGPPKGLSKTPAGTSSGTADSKIATTKKWQSNKALWGRSMKRLSLAAKPKNRRSSAARTGYVVGARQVKKLSESAVKCGITVGGHVWTARRDGTLVIRDVDSTEVIGEIDTHAMIWCLLRVGKRVWAGTETGPIMIFDVDKRKVIKEARQHSGGVYCLATDGAGHVWSGSSDFTVIEWKAQDASLVRLVHGHSNGVRDMKVVGTKYLWTACDDRHVRVIDIATAKVVATLSRHTESVLQLVQAVTKGGKGFTASTAADASASTATPTGASAHKANKKGGKKGEGKFEAEEDADSGEGKSAGGGDDNEGVGGPPAPLHKRDSEVALIDDIVDKLGGLDRSELVSTV